MPNYDVTIKSHPKDYNKLKYVIDSLKYLHPQPERVYIITPDGIIPDGITVYDFDLHFIRDNDVLPKVDKYRLPWRAGWCYQSMMSLFQNVTQNDYYLDVQSDNFFVGDIELFDKDDKPIFHLAPSRKQYHQPYFTFNEKMWGIKGRPGIEQGIEQRDSFIVEFMMYDKRITRELLVPYGGFEGFFDKCVEVIKDKTCIIGDLELYPAWVLTHHKDAYAIDKTTQVWIDAVEDPLTFTDEMIEERIKSHTGIGLVAISCHTWKNER